MPVRKVGKDCYQWGNQKVYCGNGAKEKAIKQGIAIENTGWNDSQSESKDAENFNWGDSGLEGNYSFILFRPKRARQIPTHIIYRDNSKNLAKKTMCGIYVKGKNADVNVGWPNYLPLHPEHKSGGCKKCYDIVSNMLNKEAEEIDIGTPQWGFTLPSSFDEVNSKFSLHEGYLLISTDAEGKWRVWDLDSQRFQGWNIVHSPFFPSYQKNYPLTFPHYYQFDTVDDAITHTEWVHESKIKDVKEWLENPERNDSTALGLVSKGKRATLRRKMNKDDKEMARHANRSQSWLPKWIRKELSEELRVKMNCPTCGEKVFPSLLAAQRHHVYCEKYGRQPINNLYMTPLESLMVSMRQKKEAEQTNNTWPIIALAGIGLALSIPYFLDSRGNKV